VPLLVMPPAKVAKVTDAPEWVAPCADGDAGTFHRDLAAIADATEGRQHDGVSGAGHASEDDAYATRRDSAGIVDATAEGADLIDRYRCRAG
jgi:hypothetical protein